MIDINDLQRKFLRDGWFIDAHISKQECTVKMSHSECGGFTVVREYMLEALLIAMITASHKRTNPCLSGAEMIELERERRQLIKGYDPRHDDSLGEMALTTAASLILIDILDEGVDVIPERVESEHWQEILADKLQKKYRQNKLRRLIIAGAMVASEIDSIVRKEMKKK